MSDPDRAPMTSEEIEKVRAAVAEMRRHGIHHQIVYRDTDRLLATLDAAVARAEKAEKERDEIEAARAANVASMREVNRDWDALHDRADAALAVLREVSATLGGNPTLYQMVNLRARIDALLAGKEPK